MVRSSEFVFQLKGLFQIRFEERLNLIERNLLIIKIRVIGTRDNHQLLIVSLKRFVGIFAEIAGVCLFTVNEQHGASNFRSIGQNRHIVDILRRPEGRGFPAKG